MLKALICLIWGHAPWVKQEVAVHAPRTASVSEASLQTAALAINLARGSTTVSYMCPRCYRIKVVTQ